MPYEFLPAPESETHLHLWPHRSLPKTGFVWFIGVTSLMIALPLLAVIGSPVLWGLLPFMVLAVVGLWLALKRSYADGQILEDLTLTSTEMTLTRTGPRGRIQDWQANPYWARLTLHATKGPVPNYLTLKGEGREVEIGAFLSEEERLGLYGDLNRALAKIRT